MKGKLGESQRFFPRMADLFVLHKPNKALGITHSSTQGIMVPGFRVQNLILGAYGLNVK